MKKRLLTLALALCLCLSVLPAGAAAASVSYVALGDSIAAGYGLDGYTGDYSNPSGCFPALVAGELGFSLNNLAISGDDTNDLLAKMQTTRYQTALKQADVITVTIGSNDLLKTTIKLLLEHFNMTGASSEALAGMGQGTMLGSDLSSAVSALQDAGSYLASDEVKTILDAAVAGFYTNWDTIMATLQGWNPDARVVVTNYYNPYKLFDFDLNLSALNLGSLSLHVGSLGQSYLDQMNAYITASSYNGSYYTIVDVTGVSTNVKLDAASMMTGMMTGQTPDLSGALNLDPHPDAAGHAYIAQQIVKVLSGPVRFSDVADTDWFAPAVLYAADNGLVVGYDDGTFRPDSNMTIAAYMTVLYRYARAAVGGGIPEKATTGANWVEAANWVNSFLMDGKYPDLNANMTRYQMAEITAKVLQTVSTLTGKTLNTRSTHGFTDVAPGSAHYEAVAYLESVYGIDGNPAGDGAYTFLGDNNIRRSEVAQVVYNIMTKSA